MDETRFEEGEFEGEANKKYTFFVIDGNPAMFETTKSEEDPDFRIALKLILNEMVRICCSKSLNNYIGVIVTSTKNSNCEGLENSTLLVPMGVLGQEEVNVIKEIGEEKELSEVKRVTGGHHGSDLSNVLNYCKRVFASCPNTRHQSVIYFTNNRNPFGRDDFWESSHFKRTKAAVTKIIGVGHRKTLGEFSVILLPEDSYKPQEKEEKRNEPWYQLDTDVFSTECAAAARIRQKITAQRSHATLTVNVGPGVTLDVSVFSMVMEAKPLDHSQKYTFDTEEKIVKTAGYVKKQTKMELESGEIGAVGECSNSIDEVAISLQKSKILQEESVRNRRDLKKLIVIGGQKIILDSDQYEFMNEVDSKGIDVIGFVPLNRIDREVSVVSSKIVQPNDQTTLGSTGMYRALLDRCWARQQAMICKYQSRSKQKMRIVALVPFKKDMTLIETNTIGDNGEEIEDKKPDVLRLEQLRAQADSSEWLHEGFMLVGLPFREELRDDFRRFEEQQTVLSFEPSSEQVDIMKQFVKRLTMSYNPSFYENPRLLSERTALCLEATGEELLERRDTLEPYYQIPHRLQRVGTEIEKISEIFSLNSEMKEEKTKAKAAEKKRKIADDSESQPSVKKTMTIRECFSADLIGKFKKEELLNIAFEHCNAPKTIRSKTKNDIIALIEKFLDTHPTVTWNI